MSYWRGLARNTATLAGGLLAALSGIGVAAALFPPPPLDPGAAEQPLAPRAAPASAPASAPSTATAKTTDTEIPAHGESLGEFKVSFYVLTEEASHQGSPYDTPLYRPDGSLIGQYPEKFVRDLRVQGSARLLSGDILAHAGRCEYGEGICYRLLSRKRYPWGQGSSGRPLKLMGSVAVDPRVIPYGSKIYVPELDGLVVNGKTIDGCFSVDDTGGGVRGKEIDLFAGSRKLIPQAKERVPTLRATIYRGGARCGEAPELREEPAKASEPQASR